MLRQVLITLIQEFRFPSLQADKKHFRSVTAVTMYFISDLSRALITAMELSTSLLRKDLLLKGDYVTC